MSAAIQNSTSEIAQTDGDGPEEPPHEDNKKLPNDSIPTTTKAAAESPRGVPIPPPDSGTYEKQPGYTVGALKKLVSSAPDESVPVLSQAQVMAATNAAVAVAFPSPPLTTTTMPNFDMLHIKQTSMNSNAEADTASPTSSPTMSEYDWNTSAPSTRPNSRAPSRAPSMSGGVAGAKLQMSTVATPAYNGIKKSTSTNTTSTVEPPPSPAISARGKPASVHSTDGEKHKFTLKDLLANGPKLARKSSQRSTGSRSSRKSDGGESDGGYRSGGGKSTGGDSSSSLKKYGVCQKVAIGKGATSVVRLAHKWDRSEERLYAIKVRLLFSPPCYHLY